MPCRRMHSEIWSSRACACADGAPEPGPPAGSRCLHDVWADWNAGELISELEPRGWTLGPPAFGSGKFGTPWERMQLANASAPALLLVAVGSLLRSVGPEEPQAVVATTQLIAATAIGRPHRCVLAALLVLALRNIGCFPSRLGGG